MKNPLKPLLWLTLSLLLTTPVSLYAGPLGDDVSNTESGKKGTENLQTDKDQTAKGENTGKNKIGLNGFFATFGRLVRDKPEAQETVQALSTQYETFKKDFKTTPNDGSTVNKKTDGEVIDNTFVQEHTEELANMFTAIGDGAETDDARIMGAEILNRAGSEQNTAGYQHSLNILQVSEERQGNNPAYLGTRAQANLGLGHHQAAIDDTNRAVENDDQDERAYMIRSMAYYQMKNYPKALEDAKRTLALNPNNMTAYQIAKLSRGKVTTADEMNLNAMQKAIQEDVRREYESSEQQQHQFEADTKTISPKSLQAKAPSSGDRILDSLNMKARSAVNLGDPRGAIKLTNQVLNRAPENIDALYTRAVAENLMGQYEHAVEGATEVLHRDKNHYQSLDARALALVNLKRYHEAIADADRSMSIKPDSPYSYKNRAKAKEGLGDYAGMVDDYEQAARLSGQFEDDLREAAQKYGINLEPQTLRALSPKSGLKSEEAAKPASRNKRFIVILASSVTGGLLIAFGLVHIIMGSRSNKKRLTLAGTSSATNSSDLAGSALEEGYKVIREVGIGGMGIVYEAVDKALDRKVAIKKMRDEIHNDPRERERFLSEARIVAGLHHPNIVDIHNVFDDEGELFMVFEYVEGSTIDQILSKKGKLSISEAQFIIHGVTAALSYAHTKGIIHRDLKPSNIMITKDGMVKVMDFGIARQAKDAMAASTKTNTVAGTPHYMAPEQEQGIVRKESDMFALGACLYEMLTGERPYPAPATTASKISKSYQKPSRVASNLPPELDAFMDAALEPDPDQRIQTASEFRTRLDDIKSTNELLS
jgi:tetratricopeptide (TPR) repeat protein